MSKVADAGEGDLDPAEKGEQWLERNAEHLDVEAWRDTETWERTSSAAESAEYEETGPTTFEVEFPGDEHDKHDVLLVRRTDDPDGNDYAGACDCPGFQYHGRCAHLCALARTDVLKDIVSTLPSVFDELADAGEDLDGEDPAVDGDGPGADHADPQTPPVEGVDQEASDDVQDDDPEDLGEATPVSTDQPQGSQARNRPVDTSITVKTPESGPVDLAPDWATSPIAEREGELDLNKDGCQFVAAVLGIDTEREFLERLEDTDTPYARVECTARLGDRTETRVAKAHTDEDNVDKFNANRMAETRAYKRAVKSVSGAGLLALIDH